MTDQKDPQIDLNKKIADAQKEADQKEGAEQKKEEARNQQSAELEKLQNELAQMTELAKRAMADLQNSRRRSEEEKTTWIKMANADLIRALLPILDNLDRARAHMPDKKELSTAVISWYEGIEMSLNQFHSVMKEAGLSEVEGVGAKFNPDLHEAVAQIPGEKDTVIEVFEKGYFLGDRVIRHAKVSVGNGEKAK